MKGNVNMLTLLSSTTFGGLSDLFAEINLANALSDMVDGIGSQMHSLLPIGVALLGIYAAPRIIKRVISTFL
jgi:Na+/proline symporter